MKLFEGKKPLYIAHRGFTPVAPENSLISFKEAAKRKYWAIETDVHATSDGVLVCCHDCSLKRTFGVDVIIEETPYSELKKYVMNTGNNVEKYDAEMLRIPLFEEYLTICKDAGCVPFIETKGKVVPQVLEMLEIAKMGNGGLSYNYPNLDDVPEGLIEATHENGVKVCLRAGDTPESVKRMLDMGLDYIPTNRTEPK